jgi:hypothetical protein
MEIKPEDVKKTKYKQEKEESNNVDDERIVYLIFEFVVVIHEHLQTKGKFVH